MYVQTDFSPWWSADSSTWLGLSSLLPSRICHLLNHETSPVSLLATSTLVKQHYAHFLTRFKCALSILICCPRFCSKNFPSMAVFQKRAKPSIFCGSSPPPLAASGLGRNIERSGHRHRPQAGLNEITKHINKNVEPGSRHSTIKSKYPPHPGWISNHGSSQITWLWKQNIGFLVMHLFSSYHFSAETAKFLLHGYCCLLFVQP